MNILFLDDSLARVKKFRSHCPSAKIVTTAAECIDALWQGDWDIISIDHDLGGEVFVNSDKEDCGMEVVRAIINNKFKIQHIICHSLNPAARTEMVAKLSDADYRVYDIPITVFYQSEIVQQLIRI